MGSCMAVQRASFLICVPPAHWDRLLDLDFGSECFSGYLGWGRRGNGVKRGEILIESEKRGVVKF